MTRCFSPDTKICSIQVECSGSSIHPHLQWTMMGFVISSECKANILLHFENVEDNPLIWFWWLEPLQGFQSWIMTQCRGEIRWWSASAESSFVKGIFPQKVRCYFSSCVKGSMCIQGLLKNLSKSAWKMKLQKLLKNCDQPREKAF